MKKILSLFLAFVLCFSLGAPALAAEPETFTDGAFLYEKLNDMEVALAGLSGAAPTSGLSIPERVSDGSMSYTVTQLSLIHI